VAKKASARALSVLEPTARIDWRTPAAVHAAANAAEVYWGAVIGMKDHVLDPAAARSYGCRRLS
jgi:hypothetical protein